MDGRRTVRRKAPGNRIRLTGRLVHLRSLTCEYGPSDPFWGTCRSQEFALLISPKTTWIVELPARRGPDHPAPGGERPGQPAGPDREQAREPRPILAQWIAEVLVPWYEITRDELPDCRPLHPARPGPARPAAGPPRAAGWRCASTGTSTTPPRSTLISPGARSARRTRPSSRRPSARSRPTASSTARSRPPPPPQVTYSLTAFGTEPTVHLTGLGEWIAVRIPDIEAGRAARTGS
jgi:hypothetical protein